MTTKEERFVEMTLEERAEFLGEVRVLDKVKDLVLLPSTELMTTKMVAEWFEIGYEAIATLYKRHSKELDENGVVLMKYGDFSNQFKMNGLEISPKEYGISPRGSNVFSKRAVLNVAMLLRDSIIAKRVRTALLDQQEELTDSQKVISINKEKELALGIMFAPTDGEKMLAFNDYNEYKNRHIRELENTIAEQRPMVDFHNGVAQTEGDDSIISVGKSFGIGEKKFYKFLRSVGILFIQDGYNLPKQQYQNQGYFNVRMGYFDSGFTNKTTYSTKVTGEGKTWLYDIVQKYGGASTINDLKMNEIEDYVESKSKTSQ